MLKKTSKFCKTIILKKKNNLKKKMLKRDYEVGRNQGEWVSWKLREELS